MAVTIKHGYFSLESAAGQTHRHSWGCMGEVVWGSSLFDAFWAVCGLSRPPHPSPPLSPKGLHDRRLKALFESRA